MTIHDSSLLARESGMELRQLPSWLPSGDAPTTSHPVDLAIHPMLPDMTDGVSQRVLSKALDQAERERQLAGVGLSMDERAHFQLTAAPGADAWLHAPPNPQEGTATLLGLGAFFCGGAFQYQPFGLRALPYTKGASPRVALTCASSV